MAPHSDRTPSPPLPRKRGREQAVHAAPTQTIAQARRALAEALRVNGIASPDLDARVLIGHALGLDHAGLASHAARVLSEAEQDHIVTLARRRLAHEPVARIVGRKEFWGLDLKVTPAVLVPRPETETVVEAALAAIADRTQPIRLLDLGTGSGALLLALLSELPAATGVGTDRDPVALGVARTNAIALELGIRTHVVACDFGAALGGSFDLVVSNPPYVATAEIARLDADVRDHDPHLALDGGADGLDCYRAIARDAARLLAPGGRLVVEIGQGQGAPVTALFAGCGLRVEVPVRSDLSGIPRAVSASRNP
jgi:release factor glutamine methyltransferase